MEQLKQDLTKLIQSMFDNSLEHVDDIFSDFESFEDYYNNVFVRWRFNDGDSDIDIDDFASHYDFSYFDALTIIKEHYENIGEHFEDYDNKYKIWEMVCYICAIDASYEITHDPKYKTYYDTRTPREKFIQDCNSKLKETRPTLDKLVKLQYNIENEYFVNLGLFRIDKATELLQVINLIYQKRMKICQETMNEGLYIKRCKHFKELYNELLDFKQRAIKLKD